MEQTLRYGAFKNVAIINDSKIYEQQPYRYKIGVSLVHYYRYKWLALYRKFTAMELINNILKFKYVFFFQKNCNTVSLKIIIRIHLLFIAPKSSTALLEKLFAKESALAV